MAGTDPFVITQKTPLYDRHVALGAKMVSYADFFMPMHYTNITDEHHLVRNKVGMFDVSHMGEFIVKGIEATSFLQNVTVNDVGRLNPGDVQYSCMTNLSGGIIDDLLIYRLDDVPEMAEEGVQTYMLVVNASNIPKNWRWLRRQSEGFDVKLQNISMRTGLIAVQGPQALAALQQHCSEELNLIRYYSFQRMRLCGVKNVIVSATGYTGSGGFEIYASASDIVKIWDKLYKGSDVGPGIRPCGLGARDTLRLEMGFCLYGNDITEKTTPLEAGLGWITKLNKQENFPGKADLIQQKQEGVKRRLVGFVVNDRRAPRHGYSIENEAGETIGTVTSGTHSPSLNKPIGMGYVAVEYAKPGVQIAVVAGEKKLQVEVVKLPFYVKPE